MFIPYVFVGFLPPPHLCLGGFFLLTSKGSRLFTFITGVRTLLLVSINPCYDFDIHDALLFRVVGKAG